MELFQIESFLRVAEEGSVTRAAERLNLSQPAVTRHVRALERELGVPLFERTERGMRLTESGAALQRYARGGLALLEEGRQVLRDLQAGEGGRLQVGAGVTTSIFHLPGWLRAFQEVAPGIDVTVRTGRSREVAALTLQREVDLGLVTSPVQHPELTVVELFEEEIVLVAPPDHPTAGAELGPEGFAAAPLILFSQGTGFREYLDRSFAAAGLRPWVKMESDSVEAIKSFVAVGLGLSFLPAAAVAAELRAGTLAPARAEGLPPLRRRTSVVHLTRRYLSRSALRFLEVLRRRGGAG